FPFDPGVTPVTILAHAWSDDGHATLPAVLSAPDFGQLLLDDASRSGLTARLEGSRAQHSVDLIVELPPVRAGEFCRLTFTPVILPPPDGMTDVALWQQARRGWFNVWQSSSRWGDQN